MRYSMLAYVVKMCRTLQDAADYLQTAPEGGLRSELLENGRRMFAQMRDVLCGEAASVELDKLEAAWPDCGGALAEFARTLPQKECYQVRAVFFAELGEKWDAMESVYEFMRDDPRFDPVVVRTPVGRVVNRDGKREQEIIYKDFLTPMGIPSLGYDQYDIEQDCPDLAFISQPYENCTLEQFWPENIAKHTRLVYLPYFLPAIVLKDYPTVLCQMRVYDVAWKVIGSNEKHYRYYCKHSHHGGGNMIVTGVPKLDPIIKVKQQGSPLPPGWKKIVGKTVFLWNSWFDITVSSLRFFEDIFKWFQDHEDAALIWRPHPMTDTVTKLYSPKHYEWLQQCIQAVEGAPNMVIDREASVMPSFAYSNAQISDHSSLMHQYMLMNKPLLWFQNLSSSMTGEEFIECGWMERGVHPQDIIGFMERIRCGEDRNAGLREKTIQQDLPLADGRCGERVCEAAWSALHQEDEIALPGMDY